MVSLLLVIRGVCVCEQVIQKWGQTERRLKHTHSHVTGAVNQGSVGEKKSFNVEVCESPALPESVGEGWARGGGVAHCPSPAPCAWATVVLRYCQLRAARSMAADRYMGDRWWVLGGRLDWERCDLSLMTARMPSVFSRDGSVRETLCRICGGRPREEGRL